MSGFGRSMERLRRAINDGIEDFESFVGDLTASVLRRRKVRKSLPDAVSESEHKRAARTLESGREYYNKKNHKKAAKYFRKAISIDGRYGLAHYYYGLALYKLDQIKPAKASWQRAVDVDPNSEAADKARAKLGNKKIGEGREVKVLDIGLDD